MPKSYSFEQFVLSLAAENLKYGNDFPCKELTVEKGEKWTSRSGAMGVVLSLLRDIFKNTLLAPLHEVLLEAKHCKESV